MLLKKIKFYRIELLIIIIVLLYLVFPTNNSTLDAYGYASYIKYNTELFMPHHLLYNAFQNGISKILLLLHVNLDVLLMTKVVNSIFLGFNLYISYRIFKLLEISATEIITYLLILGFSYSSIRFGTENENYIVPITFSLLASYYYLRFIKDNTSLMIFYSGLFASIACLFHQIHFFWWLGILIGITLYIKKWKVFFTYVISALLVPLTYVLVIYFYNDQIIDTHNILHFVFHDYYSGTAKSEFGINNFIFIIISSVRTLFQVHPIILSLIKQSYLFLLPLFTLVILLFVLVKKLIKKQLLTKKSMDKNTAVFIKSHIVIFILHYLFAFYAVGNIEFMVMLPFLMFISVFYYFKIDNLFLKTLAMCLLFWNLPYGLLANNLFNHYNDAILVDFIKQHPEDVFFVHEHTVLNQYSYETGGSNFINIKRKDKIKATDLLKNKNKPYFYTDILKKPQIINRSAILEKNKIDFSKNKKELIKTYKGLYGTSSIYKVYY